MWQVTPPSVTVGDGDRLVRADPEHPQDVVRGVVGELR